jgi:predicted phosphodiesterase
MTKFKRKDKAPSAILSADWHIRPDCPVCRTDNFFQAMEKKLDFILDLSKKYDCPILVAGDLGHKPLNNNWPVWLLKWTINKFKDHNIITIAGQHDLENHRLENWVRSGIGVLHAAGAINFIQEETWMDDVLIQPFSYGQEITNPIEKNKSIDICMTHQMITNSEKKMWPGDEAPRANALLTKFTEYNLILSGDNHTPFVQEHEGRLLVNPGSMMRTTADQIDHQPRVYLWYAESNEVECVYLPIKQGVISRDHIKEIDDRSDRYDSYIAKLKEEVELSLSFETNMEEYLKRFRTEKNVVGKIWENCK